MARRIAISVLLLTTLVLLLSTKPGRASCVLPACASEREFYSDSTFTTQVGDYNVTCQGVTRWGHSSCFYTHTEYGDCGNGYGGCGGIDFTCSNGVITAASSPGYVGQSCGCVPVF